MNSLRDRIKVLQAQGGDNGVNQIRREHVSTREFVDFSFKKTLTLCYGLRLYRPRGYD